MPSWVSGLLVILSCGLFLPFGIGMSAPSLSHYCILEVGNLISQTRLTRILNWYWNKLRLFRQLGGMIIFFIMPKSKFWGSEMEWIESVLPPLKLIWKLDSQCNGVER
jgi:hypothetical protein